MEHDKRIKKTAIFVGYECNNNCIFCCNSDKRNVIHPSSTAEIQEKIADARMRGSTYLDLVGGEVTIRKDIFKIIAFAKKLEFERIMFATNGRMLSNKEFAEKLLNNGINSIAFSIHGHNAELHDSLTNVPGSFYQLLKGLQNVKELGLDDIGSNTTIVKQNFKHISEIGRFIFSKGIRNSEFIFVDPTRGWPKKNFFDIVPTYKEASKNINELLKFGKENKARHWAIRYYPLCFVEEGYHDMISEVQESKFIDVEHLAPDFINMDVAKGRKTISRVHVEKCASCRHKDVCEGYWKEYVEHYGQE
jgi:MoaA/NifB/PqqE/SkfB family radical SAM enzyme